MNWGELSALPVGIGLLTGRSEVGSGHSGKRPTSLLINVVAFTLRADVGALGQGGAALAAFAFVTPTDR